MWDGCVLCMLTYKIVYTLWEVGMDIDICRHLVFSLRNLLYATLNKTLLLDALTQFFCMDTTYFWVVGRDCNGLAQ